jgi:hypothetical protein
MRSLQHTTATILIFDNRATRSLTRSGRLVGYSYLGVSGITPSLCYPEHRALAQNQT